MDIEEGHVDRQGHKEEMRAQLLTRKWQEILRQYPLKKQKVGSVPQSSKKQQDVRHAAVAKESEARESRSSESAVIIDNAGEGGCEYASLALCARVHNWHGTPKQASTRPECSDQVTHRRTLPLGVNRDVQQTRSDVTVQHAIGPDA